MSISIGEKIRSLRRERGISQETLAGALGVSFQAVSKWETGATCPDVTAIPAIASFFNVSCDELFDYDRTRVEQEVAELCRAAAEFRQTDPARSEAMLRDALRKYPGNEIILNNLLYTMRGAERSDEVIALCRSLIECTRGSWRLDDVRLDALRILAETYSARGEFAAARDAVEQIPEIYFSRLCVQASCLRGEESLEAALMDKQNCACQCVEMAMLAARRFREAGEPEKALTQLRVAKAVLEAFREDQAAPQTGHTVWECCQDWYAELCGELETA